MPELVYILSALTSLACAFLLLRSYLHHRTRLLLWSSACFVGLAANSILLLVDLYAVPTVSLALVRSVVALGAMIVLLFGLLWDVPERSPS